MATLADSLVSSSARPVAMRQRPDLTARRQRYQGQAYWVVKEPVGLNYFRFQEEEFAILEMLDGQTSLDEIKDRFEAQFPPQKITLAELHQFIGTLHRSGLVVADVPGQGHQLRKRRDERRRKEITAALTNILSIQFKGIDPNRLMDRMYPWIRWFFTRTALFCCILLVISAILLVTMQFDVFRSKLPGFHQFFSVKNAFLLAVALGVTKVIHEFGHGLSCKHFGGECHEIGVMILVLTPCLYCNVSDSWMLPNKWHRAAIGAAGMYVEVVIASICTFIWWFSEPGLLNYLCLSTMFVSGVSTIVFNANPLLRYDGYYILSDILEIPNLRQKASSILYSKLGWLCLGLESPEDPFLPQRNQGMFALFTVASVLYRWFVMISILFFLNKVFEPYGLQIVGQMIAVMSIATMLGQPLYQLGKYFWVPGRMEKVEKTRLLATLGVIAAVFLAIVSIPLPYHVISTLEIEPLDAATVYVSVPGRLDSIFAKYGQQIARDAPLARLENVELSLAVKQLEGRHDENISQLRNLQRQSFDDPLAGAQIPAIKKTSEALLEQLQEKQADLKRLQLKAPIAGTVMPPRAVPDHPTADEQLPSWSGRPLEPKNIGAYLTASVPVCYIGDPRKMKASLVIDQADIDFVTKGQKVKIELDELAGQPFMAEIADIAEAELSVSPGQLSNKYGGELPTETDASGVERPMSTSYLARVPLDNSGGLLRIGLRGKAKIYAGKRTLWQRVFRYVAQTFNFNM